MRISSKVLLPFFAGLVAISIVVFFIVSMFHSRAMTSVTRDGFESSSVKIYATRTEVVCEDEAIKSGAIDEEQLKMKIYQMEQHGAEGAVAIHVTDDMGVAIKGANIRLDFTRPDHDWRKGTEEGETDDYGLFRAEKESNWSCVWTVSKDGFHTSRGEVLFTHKGSKQAFLRGRWTDAPVDVEVVLKKVSGASIIHGMHIFKSLHYPTNTWVGLDFNVFDFVEPHGTGKAPHLFFKSVSDGIFPLKKGGTPGYTNTLHVMAGKGGLAVLNEQGDSDSPFVYEAPAHFSTNQLTFVYARTRDRIIKNTFPDHQKKEYIVFQTIQADDETNGPHVGIIRDLRCAPGKMQMEYFFNTQPGDARIDADLKSKRDIQL
ncbi:MAG: hypothetical protein IJ678_09570 [Kiritimatiellae bacterium]|nr:hypothetical protein [Kiritimatiellia bacterium]